MPVVAKERHPCRTAELRGPVRPSAGPPAIATRPPALCYLTGSHGRIRTRPVIRAVTSSCLRHHDDETVEGALWPADRQCSARRSRSDGVSVQRNGVKMIIVPHVPYVIPGQARPGRDRVVETKPPRRLSWLPGCATTAAVMELGAVPGHRRHRAHASAGGSRRGQHETNRPRRAGRQASRAAADSWKRRHLARNSARSVRRCRTTATDTARTVSRAKRCRL